MNSNFLIGRPFNPATDFEQLTKLVRSYFERRHPLRLRVHRMICSKGFFSRPRRKIVSPEEDFIFQAMAKNTHLVVFGRGANLIGFVTASEKKKKQLLLKDLHFSPETNSQEIHDAWAGSPLGSKRHLRVPIQLSSDFEILMGIGKKAGHEQTAANQI